VFRPRVSIGFGVWAGYPVAYPAYGYPVPYPVYTPAPYPAPYPQPYPSQAPGPYPQYPAQAPNGAIAPTAIGGLSFEFSPSNAEVYIDGQSVGQAGEYTPTSQPLSLTPGRHHVEVQAAGYVPMAFDVDIVAGQVVPYQGTLRPA
jgi:hypothetical protein